LTRVPDSALDDLRQRGFAVVPDFIGGETLAAAQAAVATIYPTREAYFADPAAYAKFTASQFAGIRYFPYDRPVLDALPVHPDLIDAAERFLGGPDLDLYKVELWAKYAGAIDYDQPHHRDYGNHSLVVPTDDAPQMTTILLLSDVGEGDGPTRAVPREHGQGRPTTPMILQPGELVEHEVALTGTAGTLILFRTDTFHRGSNLRGDAARFIIMVDFKRRGTPLTGKIAWPDRAIAKGWSRAIAAMTPRQRDLFGFPPQGSAYWTPATVAGVAARYPAMDMTPYVA
jgi:hypothetical protein